MIPQALIALAAALLSPSLAVAQQDAATRQPAQQQRAAAPALNDDLVKLLDGVSGLKQGIEDMPPQSQRELASIRDELRKRAEEFAPLLKAYVEFPEEVRRMPPDAEILQNPGPELAIALRRQTSAVFLLKDLDRELAGPLFRGLFDQAGPLAVRLAGEVATVRKQLRSTAAVGADRALLRAKLDRLVKNRNFVLGKMYITVRQCSELGARDLVEPIMALYEGGFDDQNSGWAEYVLAEPTNPALLTRAYRLIDNPKTADAVRIDFQHALKAREARSAVAATEAPPVLKAPGASKP
jgi:hypothetical protein